jgi:acetoin utilization deacetylase AcuC-like enzyme
MRYGIILDPVFAEHRSPAGHPECPERTKFLSSALNTWKNRDLTEAIPAPMIDEAWLGRVHTPGHIERIQGTKGKGPNLLDPDTFTSSESFGVSLKAAGSAVELTRRVIEGELDSGFALVRPPGHHAESWRPMGFCLFNNVAVAAEFALSHPSVDRVAIVDFDVHHGNGTQEIFYARSDVLYISSHESPLFPGTGSWREMGERKGSGYTVNFPIDWGTGASVFIPLYSEIVVPVLSQFKPDLILVSAGYDAHYDDPLAGTKLDTLGFQAIVKSLNSAADDLCGGRILYALEGGYNLPVLAECVLATIETSLFPKEVTVRSESTPEWEEYRKTALAYHGRKWSLA